MTVNKNNWMKLPHPEEADNGANVLPLWKRMENQARLIELAAGSYVAVKSMQMFAAEAKKLESADRWKWHNLKKEHTPIGPALQFCGHRRDDGVLVTTHWRLAI